MQNTDDMPPTRKAMTARRAAVAKIKSAKALAAVRAGIFALKAFVEDSHMLDDAGRASLKAQVPLCVFEDMIIAATRAGATDLAMTCFATRELYRAL